MTLFYNIPLIRVSNTYTRRILQFTIESLPDGTPILYVQVFNISNPVTYDFSPLLPLTNFNPQPVTEKRQVTNITLIDSNNVLLDNIKITNVQSEIVNRIVFFFNSFQVNLLLYKAYFQVVCQRGNVVEQPTVTPSVTPPVEEQDSTQELQQTSEFDRFIDYLNSFDLSTRVYVLQNLVDYALYGRTRFAIQFAQPLLPVLVTNRTPSAFLISVLESTTVDTNRISEIYNEFNQYEDIVCKVGLYILLFIHCLHVLGKETVYQWVYRELEQPETILYVRRNVITGEDMIKGIVNKVLNQLGLDALDVDLRCKDAVDLSEDVFDYIKTDTIDNPVINWKQFYLPGVRSIPVVQIIGRPIEHEFKGHKVYCKEYLAYLYHIYERECPRELLSLYNHIGRKLHLINEFEPVQEVTVSDLKNINDEHVLKCVLNKMVDNDMGENVKLVLI